MSIKETARQWVLEFLPYDRTDADLVSHLNGLDAHGLLTVYHNWMSRLVSALPRRVQISPTFQSNLVSSAHKNAVDQIIDDITHGRDLKKYLSRGVRVAAQIPRDDIKFQRRKDLDLMLIEWEMHHLHLSTNVEADGFVTRTSDVLFVIFRSDDAYLIDIMPHRSWTKEHLLKVAGNELPQAQGVHVLQGVVGLSREYTEEEHQQLRNAGINTPRMIGGQVVMASGAMTGAGTSYKTTRAVDHVILSIEEFERSWTKDPNKIRMTYKQNGVELPSSPDFEFVIIDTHGAGIREKETKYFFPFK